MVDPADVVTQVAAGVSAATPYTDPDDAERSTVLRGLTRLLAGDVPGADRLLGSAGFTTTADTDPVTGRRYALTVARTAPRAWGLYLVDLSAPTRLCVAVPHPKSDAVCDQLALRLWRAVPGSLLALAAVHRDALVGSGPDVADHAHNPRSLFHHLWTDVVGPRGIPQVQLHGFADVRAPEQVAVSTGAGPVTAAAARIADEISAVLDVPTHVTRGWDGTADVDLRATGNDQGRVAAASGWVWVHIEHNRTVRDDEARWHPVVDAVAAADPMLLAYDRPAPPGPDHAPPPVGVTSAGGAARFYAREDHMHAASSIVDLDLTASDTPGTCDGTSPIDATRADHVRCTVDGDWTLPAPAGGVRGRRLVVEVVPGGHACTVTLGEELLRCEEAAATVTLGAGGRLLVWMLHLGSDGWLVTGTAVQARRPRSAAVGGQLEVRP